MSNMANTTDTVNFKRTTPPVRGSRPDFPVIPTREAIQATLKNIASSIAGHVQELKLDGEVAWQLVDLPDKRTVVKIQYKENGTDISPVFHMSLGKRYFGSDILRMVNVETNKEWHMQADPYLLLAFLSF